MKTLRLIPAIAFLAILVTLIGSCSKKSLDKKLNNSEQAFYKDGHPSLDSVTFEIEYDSSLPVINTIGLSIDNGILVFDNWNIFKETIDDLQYQNDSLLNEWEEDIGFNSLRKYYWGQEQIATVDDLELDAKRIVGSVLETIINEDSVVVIADTLFIYRFSDKNCIRKIYSTNIVIDTIDIHFGDRLTTDDCFYGKKDDCERWTDDDQTRKVKGKKYNRDLVIFYEWGASTTAYRINNEGKLKKYNEVEINVLLEHWSQSCWLWAWENYQLGISPRCLNTPIAKKKYNAKTVKRNFVFYGGSPNSDLKICVYDCARTHHWTIVYNDDCHIARW
jgi:hypothetical protein